MIRNICHCEYKDIISLENLLAAWREFIRGKRKNKDVELFELNLMENLQNLHSDLKKKIYKHGGYDSFQVTDPKPRDIHKASVRDRLIHHAVYRKLYSYFDRVFISDSFSCRKNKGTHRAIRRLTTLIRKVSRNNTRQCYVLKCDIRKFFASINQEVLLNVLDKSIEDKDIVNLLRIIVCSFYSRNVGVGLPLGNLTSQLLVNIYMDKFDQFVKHKLKVKYYIRYADDFALISNSASSLYRDLSKMIKYLAKELRLELHPNKVSIETIHSGIDFLGWVNYIDHRVLRTKTKKRMINNLHLKSLEDYEKALPSYDGMLSWGNGYKLKKKLAERKL